MTTDQMKAFITLATCLNYTEAARLLYISQPALSRQISSLERELNLMLFVRDKRAMRLSPAGEAFLDHIQAIYGQYVDALEHARAVQWGLDSHLNIGILDGHIVSGLFPRIIQKMDREGVTPHMDLFRGSFGALSDALYNRTADLIITLEFSIRSNDQLRFLPVSHTHDYLVMLKSSPLASRKRIRAEDLRDQVLISISREDSPLAWEMMQTARRELGCTRPQKDAPSLETCALWIQAGLGISPLNSNNSLVLDPEILFYDLDKLEGVPSLQPLDTDLVVVWHQDNDNPALAHFLRALREVRRDFPISPPPAVY